ncbi:MAG: biopolymer transporter ExbD [Pseudomonadota bacterium]
MIQSRRARRMERNHKRSKTPGLNLVALIDILTILVFFMLINSSTTQNIPSQKNLKLPSSISKLIPEETLLIEITRTNILIQGVNVASVDEVLNSPNEIIPKLKDELVFLASNLAPSQGDEKPADRKVTIMGDENISYVLIRKVLTTCQQAEFTKIAFSAHQKSKLKS